MNIDIFIKHWNKYYKSLYKTDNQRELNNVQKLNRTILLIKNIYQLQKEKSLSLYQAILFLNIKNQKSKIYDYWNKIKTFNSTKDFANLNLKFTGPKEIKYIYDNETRIRMCKYYYEQYINKVNVWMMFKSQFPNLSLKTVCKIINEDSRSNKQARLKIKHHSRYYNLPFGNIQMDLKIIGPKESPTGKRITIYDAKDEQSKLYYMQIVENASVPNLLEATQNMINYFHNTLNLRIKKIRTDNAMMFKENNFVRSFPYHELLNQYNIINEKIIPKQPECNGVIERQHLIIDKEFKPLINKNDDLNSLNEKARKFMENFNFHRYHYYNFLAKCSDYKKFSSRLFIPYNFYNLYSH